MRAKLTLVASVVFFVAALFVFLSPELKDVSRETFASETPTNSQVSEGLTCQCGCGLTVANCNMPTCGFSVPMRRDIDRMIGEGKTDPYYHGVARYPIFEGEATNRVIRR